MVRYGVRGPRKLLRDVSSGPEAYWFERRAFLEAAGYRLRPKFHPDHAAEAWGFEEGSRELRDHRTLHARGSLMDARRVADEKLVMLKRVSTESHPHEVELAVFLSSLESPRNRCIPILDVLQDPLDADLRLLVMPRLVQFEHPSFETVGEAVDCFRQLLEGIEFMHANFVAHRDCTRMNFVLDPTDLFPNGFHPVSVRFGPTMNGLSKPIRRTECWPRYFIIDFGLSRRYDPAEGPPLEPPIRGGDKSAPEHRPRPGELYADECNPFPTDIYYLGNILRERFLHSTYDLLNGPGKPFRPWRFLKPLIDAMTADDPALRPTIGEVIERFDELCGGLSEWQLRRPGQRRAQTWGPSWRRVRWTLKRVPAVPPYERRTDRVPLSEDMRAFFTQTPWTV